MSYVIVETQAGKVQGVKEYTFDGVEFVAFKGIPYAEPPVGELRFRDPQPLKSWTGIRKATSHGPNCAQKDFVTKTIAGSDNCLYLNVYTRQVVPKQKWPVMVWIHGGGFVEGSADETLYGPDFFMLKDVVLVTINYRLGVLGFLNLDDEMASGNQGLKDQVMALKWVRDNIVNFGGDPNNVTIFGQSAGGASVHYLTISSVARGLFHKAISQSGVALNPWAYHASMKDKIYRLCGQLGHNNNDPKSILKFLRTIDVQKLIEAQENILTTEERFRDEYSFGPSIDSNSKNPFMPVQPEEAAANGINVPLIIGYTSREGICYLRKFSKYLDESSLMIDQILPPNVKDMLKKHYNLNSEDLMQIYFNDEPITNQRLENLADCVGDLRFVEGIHRVIKAQMDKQCVPTYFYQFTYDKEPSFMKAMINMDMKGASHLDDLGFLFKGRFSDQTAGLPVKHKIAKQMIELWVNFATTGHPTPNVSELLPVNWQPVNDKSTFRYLSICENLCIEVALDIGQQYILREYPKKMK